MISSTYAFIEKLLSSVTPRTFITSTLNISGNKAGGGVLNSLPVRGLRKMISRDFFLFSFRLLFSAHLSMFCNSELRVLSLSAGTNKYVSSAYLNRNFLPSSGIRLAAFIMNAAGPTADPWTTDALIPAVDETWPPNEV